MNKQQTGHYVVNYDQHNWEILAETLAYNHESIHYLNRAQILRDLMILDYKDLISLETAFDVLSYLSQETDLTVWRSAIDTFMYFSNLLKGGKAEEKFKQFVHETIKDIIGIVGVQNNDSREKPILSETRVFLLALACEVDYGECLQWAKTQFENYLEDSLYLDDGLLNVVLSNGPKLIDDVLFNRTTEELLLDVRSGPAYIGLLQNKNENNVKMLLKETLSTNGFTRAAFTNALLVADFDHVCEVFMGLPRENQRSVLGMLFLILEKDELQEISGRHVSADNLKKIVGILNVIEIFFKLFQFFQFNDKIFALFQISQEKLTTIPNYRLNPTFTKRDEAAFDWLTEYELSFVYPTEDSIDEISTPSFVPDEEESTFSTLFVIYDSDQDNTTQFKIETTTEGSEETDSGEDEYDQPVTRDSEELYEEHHQSTRNPQEDTSSSNPIEENQKPAKEYSNIEDLKEVTTFSGGMLFRGLSFLTFMVVPFVILL